MGELRQILLDRKQAYHKDCLKDEFINGRFWEVHEIIELLDIENNKSESAALKEALAELIAARILQLHRFKTT